MRHSAAFVIRARLSFSVKKCSDGVVAMVGTMQTLEEKRRLIEGDYVAQ